MRKKVKYLFKVMTLIMILSMILPTGLSLSQTKVFASTPVYFTDVKETDWFYKDVMELTRRGLISGYSDNTFKPNAQIRVDEFTKILISAIDENIKPSQSNYWADSYINRAKELGIIQDGEFTNYTRYITRGEMARMIALAGESVKEKGISLDVPDNYKSYYYLITDYSTLDSNSKDIALKVFVSGIITGSSDGSLNFNKNATRAEACAILMRFLEKDQRKIPELPVDFNNTLTVKEFTTQLLKALGKEANMDYALKMGYVRPSAEYPSYDKPILRREATLTMARVMDDLTDMTALFTSGDNDLFIQGYTRNHTLGPGEIRVLLVGRGGEEYYTLTGWENYRGHIKDIRMITPNYQKEMITLYLAGIIDANENKELRPYDFLTKEEAQKWINNIKGYSLLSSDEVISKLAKNIRNLEEKPMPEVEKPSNAEIWRTTSPYVNKRLYEYPLKLDKEKYSMFNFYNTEVKTDILKKYKLVSELYFNNRYTVDYRTLDAQSKYYSPYGGGISGVGNYETRVLFYHNPGHPVNGYKDEEGNDRKIADMIFADEVLKQEIEKYKKYKIVSQAELITDESLGYINMNPMVRATLRIIYYPPTDPVFLKEQGLEAGKWYEKDILIDMVNSVDGIREFRERWEFSPINYTGHYDLSSFRPMEYLK